MSSVSIAGTLTGTLSSDGGLSGRLTVPEVIAPETYAGPYTVTPGDEVQTLSTAELMMLDDVTIGAIPANYGRVDYNGGYLRIS